MRIALILVVTVYVLFCGWLVVASGLFDGSLQGEQDFILLQNTTDAETGEATIARASNGEQLRAAQGVTTSGVPQRPCQDFATAAVSFELTIRPTPPLRQGAGR